MSWIKGCTKETHPSVRKISETMKRRKIDNFRNWREKHPVHYKNIPPSPDLAELIGAVLGDGHIESFPRTERLTLAGDSRKLEYLMHYSDLIEKVFHKVPTINSAKGNGVRIGFYQKFISERLGIPTGDRKDFPYQLPRWIDNDQECLIRFLRGLFEAEGYLFIHLPTSTYNFAFVNFNKHLLNIVETALQCLEFHPEIRHNAIRIRRKAEVTRLKNLLHFRQYD